MFIALASEPGTPGAANLDWAGSAACGTAVLLDGLTEARATGCRHGTAWYVRELGTRLLHAAADPRLPLVDVLASALSGVAAAHGGICDLTHPGTPCATVAMVRPHDGSVSAPGPYAVEYLVLSDAVVVFDTDDDTGPAVVTDRRVEAHLPKLQAAATRQATTGLAAGSPAAALHRFIEAQQLLRNRPGGYWVARSDPEAADQALTGEVSGVRVALLLSDGAALMASHFDALSWRELVDLAVDQGPAAVIAATRELEGRDPDRTVWPRYKVHDDATAIVCDLRPRRRA